jgi:hypothetical protein
MFSFCENGNGPLGFIKWREILDQLRKYFSFSRMTVVGS